MSDAALDIESQVAPGDMGLEHPTLSPETTTRVSHAKLGMWIFLASDCLLFGAFISAYLLYRGRAQQGPDMADVINVPFTAISTFILLMSSLTMLLAVSAAHRGETRKVRTWLVTTATLGATFLAGQVFEFTHMYKEGLGYTTNIFGSSFYSLTGFHGAHITIGIILLLILLGMSLRGRLHKKNAEVVEVIGLYWHFVDVVWIVIFTVVYLINV